MPALFLLVTIFFWGTAFRASAIGAEHTSPIMLTALRAAPAAIVLLGAALVLRSRLPGRGLWLATVVTGLLMVTKENMKDPKTKDVIDPDIKKWLK